MTKTYLLIQPDEDGNPARFLTESDLQELLEDPEGNYGITEFLTVLPAEKNPQYWKEGQALLLEAVIRIPVVAKYRLE